MTRAPYIDDGDVRIYGGDSLEILAELEESSIDAVVTDPPYGLEFMGREWDRFRVDDPGTARHRGERAGSHGQILDAGERRERRSPIGYGGGKRATTSRCSGCGKRDQFRNDHDCTPGAEWKREILDPHAAPPTSLAFGEWVRTWALELLRVVKPGGHVLAFGGTRTFHRLTCGLEDAGFEIRDAVLDPAEPDPVPGPLLAWIYGSGFPKSLNPGCDCKPAGRWAGGRDDHGWPTCAGCGRVIGLGTALKPAWEPIVVARRPLAGTVVATLAEYGTGVLNIDGGRVGHASEDDLQASLAKNPGRSDTVTSGVYGASRPQQSVDRTGRFPANLILEHAPGCRQVGERVITGDPREGGDGERPGGFGDVGAPNGDGRPVGRLYGAETVPVFDCEATCPIRLLDEQGGASTSSARPRTSDGSMGYGGQTSAFTTSGYTDAGGPSRFFYSAKASTAERGEGNDHPTVKPRAVMRWLVRLVTPPGGVVLDPFAGSGTTLLAARDEGLRAVGIERDEDYLAIAARRLSQLSLLAGADA